MNLDERSLRDTPIFARLLTDTAVGRAGALELLADDYKPPQPPVLRASHVQLDDEESDAEPDEEGEPEDTFVSGQASAEVDEEGYPAIVNVPRTPARGVRLIRPRTLADAHDQAAS